MHGKILKQLTNSPGYDAEATLSPKGDKIVFTSIRSGDLELYTMNIDGTNTLACTKGCDEVKGAIKILDSLSYLICFLEERRDDFIR